MNQQAGEMLVQEIAPRIRHAVQALPQVGADDHAELAQDATVMSIKILASAQRRGKKFTPGNVAYFAVRHAKEGRRSGGESTTDVLAPGTQLRGRSRVSSLDEVVLTGDENEMGEPMALHDTLASAADDPALAAARKLDWQQFVRTLDAQGRAILHCLAQGQPLQKVAVAAGLSRTTIQVRKEKLAAAVREFMGPDLLKQVMQQPGWRDGLRASREQTLCRLERAAAQTE